MAKDPLWASKARPIRLRFSIERLWEEGEDVWSVSTSQTSSKGSQPAWFMVERFEGKDAPTIISAVLEARWGWSRGKGWDQKPAGHTQQEWEDQVLEF